MRTTIALFLLLACAGCTRSIKTVTNTVNRNVFIDVGKTSKTVPGKPPKPGH